MLAAPIGSRSVPLTKDTEQNFPIEGCFSKHRSMRLNHTSDRQVLHIKDGSETGHISYQVNVERNRVRLTCQKAMIVTSIAFGVFSMLATLLHYVRHPQELKIGGERGIFAVIDLVSSLVCAVTAVALGVIKYCNACLEKHIVKYTDVNSIDSTSELELSQI